MKRTISTILIIVLTLSLALSLSGCDNKAQEAKATIRVGSKDFTENLMSSTRPLPPARSTYIPSTPARAFSPFYSCP